MSKTITLNPDRSKMVVTVLVDGRPTFTDRFDPLSAKSRKAVAVLIGVADETLVGWSAEASAAGAAGKTFTTDATEPAAGPCFRTRLLTETADRAVVHDCDAERFVKTVLPTVPTDRLAEWDGLDALCCLDVDYHEGVKSPRDWLETVVFTRVSPRPIAWHFSRSGGLHLFYVAAEGFEADELAASAALRFRSIDSSAGLELKRVVRGPGSETVHTTEQQDTGRGFLMWLGSAEYDEAERDAWLTAEGMECGKRYDHDKCPIAPSADPGRHRQPVMVSETGVYCFKCEGTGLSLGSRKPGVATWPALLGAPSAGDLGTMIRSMTHWGHARWVLTEKYGLPEPLARRAYKAALKAYHAGTPKAGLVGRVFDPHNEGMARSNNLWVSIEDSYTYPRDIQSKLALLPAACYVDEEGKTKADAATVCELQQGKDLTRLGYPNLNVIHGFKMTAPFLSDTRGETTVAVPARGVMSRHPNRRPRYIPKTKRLGQEEAWQIIESIFPKIDRTLVTTALCAFACAQETRAGLLPIVFVTGPTGAAKTSTLRVAAGMYGATTHDTVHESDPARFRQNIWKGASECPVVLCNEILKDSARGRLKLSPREALDPLLNLTPDSASWVAYQGPIKMGRLPAIFLTEPVCPLVLRDESQLARRTRW